MTDPQQTVSLVLGSGGARGLAHIGIIHWLEQHGYYIRSVAGCSMGALIGGIYATGKLDEYEQWVRAITKLDILTYLDFSFSKNGFVKGDRLMNTLNDLIGDCLIEELPITFTAVATDLTHSREIWINTGSLFDAIRASISIPFLFTPFFYHGTPLIDGGILNPVPIAPTFHDMTDLTIAVNLNGPPAPFVEEDLPPPKQESGLAVFQKKISQFLITLQPLKSSKPSHDLGMYEIAHQAFEAMQGTIARQKLAAYPPDIVIEIARNACGMMEFNVADRIIALGYEKAEAYLNNWGDGREKKQGASRYILPT